MDMTSFYCIANAVVLGQTIEWVILSKNILNIFLPDPRFHGNKQRWPPNMTNIA